MESLLMSIALKYGGGKLTDAGLNYASKLLGLDQQTQNPKYAISMGGQTIDVGNAVKKNLLKTGLNQGIKAITGGSKMGMALPLMAGGLGLAYLRNPLRPGSMNYNPALKSQMDYLNFNNMIGSNQDSGLTQYGSDSILSGQNVVSLFGTNDYEKQLNKYKNKYKNTMPKNRLDKLNKEIADIQDYNVQKTIEKNQLKNLQNINAGGSGGNNDNTGGDSGSVGASDSFSNKTGKGRTGYAQGGIASLWQR